MNVIRNIKSKLSNVSKKIVIMTDLSNLSVNKIATKLHKVQEPISIPRQPFVFRRSRGTVR